MVRFAFMGAWMLAVALAYAGCGQSPDELYGRAKTLIADKATLDEGLRALETFEDSYTGDPRTPEVVLSIATAYQTKGDYDRAVGAYHRLSERYPGTSEDYKGRFLLGYLYYDNLQDTEHATEVFNAFIADYPDSELTASAKVLMENIDRPIEEWAVFDDIDDAAPGKENVLTGE